VCQFVLVVVSVSTAILIMSLPEQQGCKYVAVAKAVRTSAIELQYKKNSCIAIVL